MLNTVSQHTSKVVLAGISLFEPTGNLAGLFDADAAGRDNDMIQKIAAERELPFVNLRNDLRGYNLTVDGIHLDAAGYLQWMDAIVSSIRSSFGCAQALAR
jgi:lysophospholipase L1-like esterase